MKEHVSRRTVAVKEHAGRCVGVCKCVRGSVCGWKKKKGNWGGVEAESENLLAWCTTQGKHGDLRGGVSVV